MHKSCNFSRWFHPYPLVLLAHFSNDLSALTGLDNDLNIVVELHILVNPSIVQH